MRHWANPGWGFVLMGQAEADYLNHLRALVCELGVERRFVVLPPVGYDEVAQFTEGADVGHALYRPAHINNVYIATASNKIMEYMAAGLPLLVSDTPATRALVEKYGCGVAADEESPEALGAAVNRLLGDRTAAKRMGAAAARAFDEEFSYRRQFSPVLNAYNGFVDGRGEFRHPPRA
jgi:glycosyltransferase involved in cell wall biosynthesis